MRSPGPRRLQIPLAVVLVVSAAFWFANVERSPGLVLPARSASGHPSPAPDADKLVMRPPAVTAMRAPPVRRTEMSLAGIPSPPSATEPIAATAPSAALDAPVKSATATAAASAPADGLAVQRVEICGPVGGSALNITDALQSCIDRAPAFSVVELPPGTYVLGRQIVITKPLTIRTAGSAGGPGRCVTAPQACAVLMAGPELLDDNGFLLVQSTSNVTLEHVVLDGNREARLSSIAARFCLDGRNVTGFNAAVLDCIGCALRDVVSRNALCGTGLEWIGGRAAVERSAFIANGDASTPRMWADGLTLVYAPDSEIRLNQFINNSDIALIIGQGPRSRIEENTIIQRTQPAFAGIMLHNFGSDDVTFRGDFRDAVITDNTVDCGAQLCVFGVQVGPRPWDVTRNIVGGDLHQNRIRGAKVGINVDGAGTFRAPTRIFGNVVSDVPADAYFSACPNQIPTTWMNVAPNSVVDRHAEESETGEHLSELCQLSSGLADVTP